MLKTKYMKSIFASLDAYTTKSIMIYFYFPSPGDFSHFPSMISKEQVIVAKGKQNNMKVESTKRILQVKTFDDLLETGSNQEILDYLRTENLNDKK